MHDRDTHNQPSAQSRSLTLSREAVRVGTERVPARRVRLEKYVVTETRTFTVEVRREEVRLIDLDVVATELPGRMTDEPLTGADPDRWLTLSEERVVVTTSVVPLERVRLHRTSVTADRAVTELAKRETLEPAGWSAQLHGRSTNQTSSS